MYRKKGTCRENEFCPLEPSDIQRTIENSELFDHLSRVHCKHKYKPGRLLLTQNNLSTDENQKIFFLFYFRVQTLLDLEDK